MSERRVLVTGGAGFIGSHLVESLARRAKVTVFDDFSVGRREDLPPRVRVCQADVRDRAAVERACARQHVVFHLAVQCLRLSLRDPFLVHEVNATGTLNVAEACRKHRVGRLVYCSSSEIYGTALRARMSESHPTNPTTPYGASKLAGEHYVRAYQTSFGLPAVIVRPFNTYGPRAHVEGPYGEVIPKFVLRALGGMPPVIFGDGRQTRDFTFVEDTVSGLLRAASSEEAMGREINIGTGAEVSIEKLAREILRVTGRSDLSPVRAPPRPGDVRRHRADVARARRLLGFVPKVSLSEGLVRYVRWVRSNQHDLMRTLAREGAWAGGIPA